MTERPDWLVCVRERPHKALCGRDMLPAEFYLVGEEHARNTHAAGGRLVVCEDCLRVMNAAKAQ